MTAVGLPPDIPVFVGLGEPRSAFEVVQKTAVPASGELTVKVDVPEWARAAKTIVAVVGAQSGEWVEHSDPIAINQHKTPGAL